MAEERDSSNLIAFVAMLLAAVGFKEVLQNIHLYGTSISLLHILGVAALLFGAILYFQLLNESYLSLQNARAAQERQLTDLFIKGAYFLGLVLLFAGPVIIMIVNGIADILAALRTNAPSTSELITAANLIAIGTWLIIIVGERAAKIDRSYRELRLKKNDTTDELALLTQKYQAQTNKTFSLRPGAAQAYADELAKIDERLAFVRRNKLKKTKRKNNPPHGVAGE